MVTIVPLDRVTEDTVREIDALHDELHIGERTARATRERIEEVLADPQAVLMTAQDEGKVVGMATLYVMPKTTKRIAQVDDVVVSSAYRGQGLGEKLMRAITEVARERGVATVNLTSRPARVAAQKLYEKVGYEKRETDVFRLTL